MKWGGTGLNSMVKPSKNCHMARAIFFDGHKYAKKALNGQTELFKRVNLSYQADL
jgi:hypothetical protein